MGGSMCNLWGFYKKNINLNEGYPEIIPNVELLKLRGRDAFGTVYVGSYGELTKRVSNEVLIDDSFWYGCKYFAFESRAIPEPELIEHGREGLVPQRDTQPFYNNVWITSHNGTIIQPDKIIFKWALKPLSPVDSAILPELFSKSTPEIALRYNIDGSFAVAAYDRASHILHLMATFQPLYYVVTDEYVYYASIEEQLEYLHYPIQKVAPYTSVVFDGTKEVVKISLYRYPINNKVLVICSGGLDSVTTARLYQVLGYDVSLVHFLYSQAAEKVEDLMMRRIAKFYGYPLLELNVRNVFKKAAASSRLLSKKPAESALDDAEGTPSYVGNRNMIFGAIASGIAEENQIGRVVMGLNLSDSSAYPDNALPYLLNMEETLQTSLNQQQRVLFRSPFVNLMKHEILDIAIAIGSPLQWQVSCYYPTMEKDNPKYCKGCGSHLLRSYAFKFNHLKDPVPYEENFDFGQDAKELSEDFWKRVSKVNLKLEPKDIPFYEQIKNSL